MHKMEKWKKHEIVFAIEERNRLHEAWALMLGLAAA